MIGYSFKTLQIQWLSSNITIIVINFWGIWGHVVQWVENKIALLSVASICSTDIVLLRWKKGRFLLNLRKHLQTYTSSHPKGCISYYAPPCKSVISHNSYRFWHIFSSEMNWTSKHYASSSHPCCRLPFRFKHPVESQCLALRLPLESHECRIDMFEVWCKKTNSQWLA